MPFDSKRMARPEVSFEMSETFESSRAPEAVGAFPHAKRVGNLIFLSGIGPRVRGSKEIPGVILDADGHILSHDIEKQCRAVFENVRLVLEDAGASWNDIVDVTVFLTNMARTKKRPTSRPLCFHCRRYRSDCVASINSAAVNGAA